MKKKSSMYVTLDGTTLSTLESYDHLNKLRFSEHLGALHGDKYTAKRIP